MRKMKNSKGFTLMEMLIVVAIIAILVAIMIPTLTTQLERARETADLANIRSAYAEATVDALTNGAGTGTSKTVTITQTGAGFKYVTDIPSYLKTATWTSVVETLKKGDTVTVSIDAEGAVSYAKG